MNQELYQKLLCAGELLINQERTKRKIQELQAQIQENKDEIEKAKKKITEQPKHYILKNILGIGAIIFGAPLTLMMSIVVIVICFSVESDGGPLFTLLGVFLLGGISFCCVVLPFLAITIAGIVLLISIPRTKKKNAKIATENHTRIKEQNEATNESLTQQINQIADEFIEYWNSNLHLLDFLPEDYRTAHAVCFMLKAVKNFRADSLKEAINLYDQELKHLEAMAAAERQRIQNEELLYTMELLNLNMETMNSNQERTNRKLDDISFMQTMQMFDD